MIRFIATWTVAIIVAVYLARQARKPQRWIGRPFLWAMNASHCALTNWGLEHVLIEKDFRILDIGRGGGRTIQKLAAIASEGFVWPDLVNDMKEVRRVLKSGGRLVVIAETYKGGRFDNLKAPVMKLLKSSHLSADDHRELFLSAGYDDVQVIEEKKRGWICASGTRPR